MRYRHQSYIARLPTANTSCDCTMAELLTTATPHDYCHMYMSVHCRAATGQHCRLEWHAYALNGPPAVVKTYSAHNALPLLLG